jgi:hypothetical protein
MDTLDSDELDLLCIHLLLEDNKEEDWDLVTILGFLLSEDVPAKRRFAVHPINHRRAELGLYVTLVEELQDFEEKFYTFFRITRNQFAVVLDYVRPIIEKSVTNFKIPISPAERLSVCLR